MLLRVSGMLSTFKLGIVWHPHLALASYIWLGPFLLAANNSTTQQLRRLRQPPDVTAVTERLALTTVPSMLPPTVTAGY
jgi:hypothetical protein